MISGETTHEMPGYPPLTLKTGELLMIKVMGESCTQILQRKRIAQARWLLRDMDLSIVEIAQAIGYENTGHFHRLFEREVGMSPKGYRAANSGRNLS